jgi:hypothetical protein
MTGESHLTERGGRLAGGTFGDNRGPRDDRSPHLTESGGRLAGGTFGITGARGTTGART